MTSELDDILDANGLDLDLRLYQLTVERPREGRGQMDPP